MQITSRFTIGVHIIVFTEYYKDKGTVTSSLLAASIGANPVIVRTVMSQLKLAGIIDSSQGKSGISLKKPMKDITFYDVYKAVDCVDETGLFHFHENPSIKCDIGRNIHKVMDGRLEKIQNSMEEQMKRITLAEVTDDILKEIESEK